MSHGVFGFLKMGAAISRMGVAPWAERLKMVSMGEITERPVEIAALRKEFEGQER
jgi:hypothetical protein